MLIKLTTTPQVLRYMNFISPKESKFKTRFPLAKMLLTVNRGKEPGELPESPFSNLAILTSVMATQAVFFLLTTVPRRDLFLTMQ